MRIDYAPEIKSVLSWRSPIHESISGELSMAASLSSESNCSLMFVTTSFSPEPPSMTLHSFALTRLASSRLSFPSSIHFISVFASS
jgi:hypothetical protein